MLRKLAGALGLTASLCFAQDDAVVITATRFPDAKRDLPVGVTLISADDIQKSASSNLADILAQFGLVSIRDNTGTPNQQIDLRGFGITGDQNAVVMVDGIRLSENELSAAQLSTIPLESIERIEIVRGGGAVLYGGGATGGTINIITKRLEAGRSSGYGVARGGGYGTKEVRAGYRGMGETLGIALDTSHEDTEGYRRNNRFRQSNITGLLEARGAEGRTYLRTTIGRQDLHLPGALTEAQIAADPRQAGPVGKTTRDDGSATFGVARSAGRHEFAAELGYWQKQAPASFPGFEVDTRVERRSFLPRGKFRFDALGREHDATIGVDFEDWDLDSRSTFGTRRGTQENIALYALGNFWATPSTRLVLGGRTQESDVSLAPNSASHRLSAYEAALRQRFAGGWSAYGKFGTSFRLANFDEICFAACASPLLKPQKARAGELATEYEARGARLRLAAFEIHLQDEIYFSPLVFDNINLPPTRRRGLELEGAWQAAASLNLRASFAWTDAEFRSGTIGGTDVSGKKVPLVPRVIATAGAAWSITSQQRFNLHARYVGRQYYDNDQVNAFARMPAYALFDAKFEQRAGRASFALELRNIFDKEYYSYGIWTSAPTFSAYPQPGRALYASLAYRLD